jgi:hypothetical protein
VDGATFETIPEKLLVKAALVASSQLLSEEVKEGIPTPGLCTAG